MSILVTIKELEAAYKKDERVKYDLLIESEYGEQTKAIYWTNTNSTIAAGNLVLIQGKKLNNGYFLIYSLFKYGEAA
jgi:hypothetical protein